MEDMYVVIHDFTNNEDYPEDLNEGFNEFYGVFSSKDNAMNAIQEIHDNDLKAKSEDETVTPIVILDIKKYTKHQKNCEFVASWECGTSCDIYTMTFYIIKVSLDELYNDVSFG